MKTTIRQLLYSAALGLLLLGSANSQAATDCNAVTEISKIECQSLLELYHSTGGPNWTRNDGWNVTNTPCSWYGIRCENQRVTEIDLGIYSSSNNLSGSIPNFSGLPELQTLYLYNNQLTWVPDFSALPKLQTLSLSGNQLTLVPDFSALPELRTLWLYDNQLTSVPDFSALPKLQTLYLGYNQLTSVPDFSALPQLQELSLSSNQLTGPIPDFSHLTELETLDIRGNAVCKNSQIDYMTWSVENTGRFAGDITWQQQLDSLPYCPIAQFTATPVQGPAPLTVALDGRASTDTDGTIASYSWWSSDGQTVGGETPTASLTFSQPGTYTINFGVGDNQGVVSQTVQTTVTVVKPNAPPTAAFTLSTAQGFAPLPVTLDASDSTDDGMIVKYEWSAGGPAFATGKTITNTFSPGEYTITLTVTDNQGQTATATQSLTVSEPEPPEPDGPIADESDEPIPGQAIIIAGPSPTDNLFKYSHEFTQRMYRLLRQRGYDDDKVQYLSVWAPDIETPLDGRLEPERQDYDLFDPEKELAEAFTQAASELTPGQQFVFYLHAHAHPNATYLVNYELSASRLRELFATIPAEVEQIIILDTCYSGSFLDELSGVPNRVVVASTNDKSKTWQIARTSFADEFLGMLQSGSSLGEAFRAAEDMILNNSDLFSGQRPWLDDDGDGQFFNDGLKSEQIFVGRRKIDFAAPQPKIEQIHPLIRLPDNTSTATLWIRTNPGHQFIHRVRAVLVEPNYQVGDYQGKNTKFNQSELELIYNAAQNRYETAYSGFTTAGRWRILYQVQDVEGNWSESVQGEVQAPGLECNPCVQMLLNQSRYSAGDPLRLDMTVNGNKAVDLYVAIVFPDGYFITVTYPLNFSWPNAIQVYRPNVEIAGQQTFAIMNFPVPNGIANGPYAACGVLVQAGRDSNDRQHWIHQDCLGFEVD
jgi:PKD repeat protein